MSETPQDKQLSEKVVCDRWQMQPHVLNGCTAGKCANQRPAQPQAPAPSLDARRQEINDAWIKGCLAGREEVAAFYEGRALAEKAQVARILRAFGGRLPTRAQEGQSESEIYNRRRFSVQLAGLAAEIRNLPAPTAPKAPPTKIESGAAPREETQE